jgi:hypothetical protein
VRVECFQGIRAERLHKVIEKRDMDSPGAVVIYVGTDDLRTSVNLDRVM